MLVDVRNALPEWDQILDALPFSIALLDRELNIVAVNDGWLGFGERNGLAMPDGAVGTNYAEICAGATGRASSQAAMVLRGLTALQVGAATHFAVDYDCHSPQRKRWFTMVAARTGTGLMLVHRETTTGRLLETHPETAPRELLELLAGDRQPMLEPIDLGPLLAETIHGVGLDVEDGLWVLGDSELLSRAFAELANLRGGPTTVHAAHNDDEVVISCVYRTPVGDWDGFGIEPFDWHRWPGGLGLPYVRAAVQAHEGWMATHGENHMHVDMLFPAAGPPR